MERRIVLLFSSNLIIENFVEICSWREDPRRRNRVNVSVIVDRVEERSLEEIEIVSLLTRLNYPRELMQLV